MNVKCPNCRFKFDVNQTDTNEHSCICPRCGKSVSVMEHTMTNDIENASFDEPQGSEAELFFTAKALVDEGRYQEARTYITKLLEISPDEVLYLGFKNELDIIDEERQYVEQQYSTAVSYIDSGHLELAETIVDELLQINPLEPLYQELSTKLYEKKLQKAQQVELERLKKEARRQVVSVSQPQQEECRQKEEFSPNKGDLEEENLLDIINESHNKGGCVVIALVFTISLLSIFFI